MPNQEDRRTLFGLVLKNAMRRNGLQNSDIAHRINKQDSAVSHMISGRTRTIDKETSEKLAELMKTPPLFWSNLKEETMNGQIRTIDEYLAPILPQTTATLKISGTLVDFQIRERNLQWVDSEDEKGVYPADAFAICPFDENRLHSMSYDTLVGGYWGGKPAKDNLFRLKENEKIIFAPQEVRYVYTDDFFKLPPHIYGEFGGTGELVLNGFEVIHGPKIDPSFSGRLTVAVRNFLDVENNLAFGARFIKVVFSELPTRPEKLDSKVGFQGELNHDPQKAALAEREVMLRNELEEILRQKEKFA